MRTLPKITAADYDDLLAAAETGTTQRELARRYGCAPSLIARHQTRARDDREADASAPRLDSTEAVEHRGGSIREILETLVRDPKTSARDVASLTNAIARLTDNNEPPLGPSLYDLRRGTLILEPGPRTNHDSEPRYRLILRVSGGIEHVSADYDLTPTDAIFLVVCAFSSHFGITLEEILGHSPPPEAVEVGGGLPNVTPT